VSPDIVFTITFAIVGVVALGLVYYAMHRKGDVSAEVSYGATTFRLYAKDRRVPRHTDSGK
jgi:hypothetical protein